MKIKQRNKDLTNYQKDWAAEAVLHVFNGNLFTYYSIFKFIVSYQDKSLTISGSQASFEQHRPLNFKMGALKGENLYKSNLWNFSENKSLKLKE